MANTLFLVPLDQLSTVTLLYIHGAIWYMFNVPFYFSVDKAVRKLWHFGRRPTERQQRVRTLSTFLLVCIAAPQCSGSVTFWYRSGSGSCSFLQWLSRCQKMFFSCFFCLLLSEGTLSSFFKDKKLARTHKTVVIKVFLNFFACWWKDPDPDPYKRIRNREARKLTDPAPDSEHWFT